MRVRLQPELRDIYAGGFAGPREGMPMLKPTLVWQQFEQNPNRMSQVTALIGQLVMRNRMTRQYRWRASWGSFRRSVGSGDSL